MKLKSDISLVVAFLPHELGSWDLFFESLVPSSLACELVAVSPLDFTEFHYQLSDRALLAFNQFLMKPEASFEYVKSLKPGRAYQYNAGVEKSSRKAVWLLHIDSLLSTKALQEVSSVPVSSLDDGLAYYFALDFFGAESAISWNQFFGNLRADFLGMIYGDQSFLVSRDVFFEADGFDENLAYGEDHDFVWRTRLLGLRWKKLPGALQTSARAYESRWLELTSKRVWLGFKQAIPYQRKCLRSIFTRKRVSNFLGRQTPSLKPSHVESSQMDLAIVVFVKTPGFSPLKTRLAKTIGSLRAENFHLIACKKLQSTILAFPRTRHRYWAVAEADALHHPLWSKFKSIGQGDLSGGLGDRLHHVYGQLIKKHNAVIFLGADSPQLSTSDLEEARQSLVDGRSFYLGRAKDGGYFLFAGSSSLTKETWLEVPYSVSNTAEEFARLLREQGSFAWGSKELEDVDTESEYLRVANQVFGPA